MPASPARVPTKERTKQRILRVAEALFAQHSFNSVSLRELTATARSHIAAVHYHFGTKDQLLEAVIQRQMDPLNECRFAALRHVAGAPNTTVEDVLAAFIVPALELSYDASGALFIRVLTRAFTERDEVLYNFLLRTYPSVIQLFTTELVRLLPHLNKADLTRENLYWRIDLVMTYAISGFHMIRRKDDIPEHEYREQAAAHLIRFAATGLKSH